VAAYRLTCSRLIIIPLSFLRRLDSLKYTSIIALISIAYLVLLVVAHYIKGDTLEERGTVRVFRWAGPVTALAAFPVIVFAYTCHQNVKPPTTVVYYIQQHTDW
jgi:amino acid permease